MLMRMCFSGCLEVMNGRMRRTNQGHEVMSPLMGRISSLGLTMAATTSTEKVLAEELFVTEEEFLRLIRKTEVQQLLCDMDINVEPREGILAAFVTEEDGSVSMSEIVSGLMRFGVTSTRSIWQLLALSWRTCSGRSQR